MKQKITVLLIVIANHLYAQTGALQGMVDAEYAFIASAKQTNTRDAFLAFLADDAVTVGTDLQVGKDYLLKQSSNESLLSWRPVYTDISASGDFGFNTGPWEFRKNRNDKNAIAFGQFVTVWKKVGDQWKAAVDMGISHQHADTASEWKSSAHPSKISGKKSSPLKNEVLDAEKKFIAEVAPTTKEDFLRYCSEEVRVFRGGSMPMVTKDSVQHFLSMKPAISYDVVGGGVSPAGDMAFVYGKATVGEAGVENGNNVRNTFYLRIWKLENNAWKIVVDLLQ